MDIGGYCINGYWWLLVAILLLTVSGYWWLFYYWLLVAIGDSSITGY
jgi:hypothetical protein